VLRHRKSPLLVSFVIYLNLLAQTVIINWDNLVKKVLTQLASSFLQLALVGISGAYKENISNFSLFWLVV
jgi:hypothetical protein